MGKGGKESPVELIQEAQGKNDNLSLINGRERRGLDAIAPLTEGWGGGEGRQCSVRNGRGAAQCARRISGAKRGGGQVEKGSEETDRSHSFAAGSNTSSCEKPGTAIAARRRK